MSASTVSITANPATRRRPVVVGERKAAVELLSSDGAAAIGGGGDAKVTGGRDGVGKDLIQSVRVESILERSREVQLKKSLPGSLPRKPARKGVTKPEKPRWLTLIRVFTKNLFLLLVVLGFVQMIRRLVLGYGNGGKVPVVPSMGVSVSDFEGRIAEMESFVKTTTKMMQVQVEVVDRKIGNEIGVLRKDLNKKIDDKGFEFETELKKLKGKTESLEKYMGELKGKNLLSKEEFESFFDEFRRAKGLDVGDGNGNVNLDEIRVVAREIVEREIEKHAADGLGRVDYALAAGGAAVVKHSEPYVAGKKSGWFPTSYRNRVQDAAGKMLRPSFGEPGQCFPLEGSSGFVQIRLRTAIIPEAITLEHVAKSVAYDRSSAPKDCRVYGWLQGNEVTDQADKMVLLTKFTYDLEKSNAQTFNLLDSSRAIIDTVRFYFSSNHGSATHTCIYRLRVHGHEPNSL